MEVAEAVPEFAEAFPFEEFNAMQRAALPALLETDDNVVACAPTASGKTTLAELAMIRTLRAGGTALFVAPMRALTNEKESEWERFEDLGYSVYVATGERDLNPRRARRADVLVMTPEKVDSATRDHEAPRNDFVSDVDLVVVDEVHLLDSDRRGSVLEVVVARLRRLWDPRVVALSATLPNAGDVAEWLDAPEECIFQFDDDYRPVELHADVQTYTHGENSFADKYRRLYRALDRAEPHLRDDGQALVFVASRRDTVAAAKKARDELAERDVPIGARGDYDFHTETEALEDDTLRKSVLDGVAFHHAGLSKNDRDLVEEWFREGRIELLFSTTTLAWGVNLPARCVVIRDTKLHDPLEGEVDMSPVDVLQMLGRAGRPDYDDVGYAWVVCDREEADRYRRLLREGTTIESRLADDLAVHLNAEVATGTVGSVADAVDWLRETYYHVRATRAPGRYDGVEAGDATGDDGSAAEDGTAVASGVSVESLVRETVEDLVARGFLEADDEGALSATGLGSLASSYYLRLPTARRFEALVTRDSFDADDVLRTVAGAAEFESVTARSGEHEAIEAVLGADAPEGGTGKVLAVLQAATEGSTPAPLRDDAWALRRNARRLMGALRAAAERFDGAGAANLVRRVEARVEHGVGGDGVALTAIDGVGEGRAERLAAAGLTTPATVRAASDDDLATAGLTPGVAERVRENAADLPDVTVEWGDFPGSIAAGERDMREVTVRDEGGGARAGVRVTVNGHEMTETTTYLGTCTVPVAVFGGDAEELELAVRVAFPELPLPEVVETRTVVVEE